MSTILALNVRGNVAPSLCQVGSLMLFLDRWTIVDWKLNDQKTDCSSRAFKAEA